MKLLNVLVLGPLICFFWEMEKNCKTLYCFKKYLIFLTSKQCKTNMEQMLVMYLNIQ